MGRSSVDAACPAVHVRTYHSSLTVSMLPSATGLPPLGDFGGEKRGSLKVSCAVIRCIARRSLHVSHPLLQAESGYPLLLDAVQPRPGLPTLVFTAIPHPQSHPLPWPCPLDILDLARDLHQILPSLPIACPAYTPGLLHRWTLKERCRRRVRTIPSTILFPSRQTFLSFCSQ